MVLVRECFQNKERSVLQISPYSFYEQYTSLLSAEQIISQYQQEQHQTDGVKVDRQKNHEQHSDSCPEQDQTIDSFHNPPCALCSFLFGL